MTVRAARITSILIITLLTAGCWGAYETEDIAYILTIGIDKAEGNKQKVTYQLATSHNGGKDSGASSKNEDSPWVTNTILMPTPTDGRMLLNASISRYPSVSHIRAFVISEEAARAGLGSTLSYVIRNHDFRETIYLLVVKGSAQEYIINNKPQLERTVSRFYDNFFTHASETGYFLRSNIHNFYTKLKNPGSSPFAVYSVVDPSTPENKPTGTKAPEATGDAYLPGDMPRTSSESSAEFMGLAVFKDDKMVGVLDSTETRSVAIVLGGSYNILLGVIDPIQPDKDFVNIGIINGDKPQITANMNNGNPIINIEVHLGAEILGITSGISYEKGDLKALLENQISSLLENNIRDMLHKTQLLGTDVTGLTMHLRPQFANFTELEKADLSALYQAADISVKVTTKIRRSGLLSSTYKKHS